MRTASLIITCVLAACFAVCLAGNADHDMLMELYHATNGKNWTNKDNWGTSQSICDWYGVTCDSRSQFVTTLILPNNNLCGELPESLGDPGWIILNFSHNNLVGGIPASFCTSLGLQILDLSYNQLTAGCPWINYTEIDYKLPLTKLDLSNNQLQGDFPLGFNLDHLPFVNMSHNLMQGALELSESAYGQLQSLDVSYNNLSGKLPDLEYWQASIFFAQHNRIGGILTFSEFFMNYLDVSYNQITGELPDMFWSLMPQQYFDMSHNLITGLIPERFEGDDFGFCDMSNNYFICPLPPGDLDNCSITCSW